VSGKQRSAQPAKKSHEEERRCHIAWDAKAEERQRKERVSTEGMLGMNSWAHG